MLTILKKYYLMVIKFQQANASFIAGASGYCKRKRKLPYKVFKFVMRKSYLILRSPYDFKRIHWVYWELKLKMTIWKEIF